MTIARSVLLESTLSPASTMAIKHGYRSASDCMDSEFLCGSTLHLGKTHGEFFNYAGDLFPWVFSGVFVPMVALWIACNVIWNKAGGMCSHSTVRKEMNLMRWRLHVASGMPIL